MNSSSRRRKVPTNLSLRADLIERARALDLNLSEVLETALEATIRAAERARWLESNQEAIEQYNELVQTRGLFSDDWRKF